MMVLKLSIMASRAEDSQHTLVTVTRLGASVEEITLPDFEIFNSCGRVIITAESYAIHEEELNGCGRRVGGGPMGDGGQARRGRDAGHAGRFRDLRFQGRRHADGGVVRDPRGRAVEARARVSLPLRCTEDWRRRRNASIR